MADKELAAMAAVATAFEELDPMERARVLSWAASKFGGAPLRPSPAPGTANVGADDPNDTLAEFFARLSPRTEKEKALAVAYWMQFREGLTEFVSQDVNGRLKDLGYPIKNITDALSQLQSENPKRVVQLRKSGSSRQARKTYKVTDAGRRSIESMPTGETS
ncbi:MAG: hypothetical protein R3C30_06970 [Hyphomonadaceae bacterium]